MSFHFTERDLDLIQLEELHSNSGYARWFSDQIGLGDWVFDGARHSVSAKVNGRWGETDVLAFFVQGPRRQAVLIEDKVAAQFTELQGKRYHERGEELIRRGECQGFLSVLVAPARYLNTVPEDDLWSVRVSVEKIAEWFSHARGHHALWRTQALKDVLDRVNRSTTSDSAEIVAFSAALAIYLASHHSPALWHRPGKDKSGPILHFPGTSSEKTLWWKFASSQMTLQLMNRYQGLAEVISLPLGIELERAGDHGRKCDYLAVVVPPVDLYKPLEEQLDIVESAVDAARKLVALVPQLDILAAKRHPPDQG